MSDIQVTGSPAVFNENVTFYSDVNITSNVNIGSLNVSFTSNLSELNVSSTSNLSELNVSGISSLSDQVFSAGTISLTNNPFVRNTPIITSNYGISSSFNEMSVGPITIQTGVTVTVNSGATWSIV
jgi:hypothetical protein